MAKQLLSVLILLVALSSCNSSKEVLRQAEQYSEAGMHQEAFKRYVSAYQQDPNSIEAHIGAKSMGNFLANKYFAEVQLLVSTGNYESALRALDVAEQFYHEYQWLHIERPLNGPLSRTAIRQKIGENYYQLALQASLDDNWDAVDMYLSNVARYAPNHPEANYLELMSSIVPEYKRGVKAMELGLYQEAIPYFEKVIGIDADFSDALALYYECIELSNMTVAYIHTTEKHIGEKYNECLVSYVHEEILSKNNPFVTLVSRDKLNHLTDEQILTMGGTFNEESVVEAGNFLGAEFLILGEISGLEAVEDGNGISPLVRPIGFNGLTRIKREESRSRTLKIIYKYQLVNAETGEIVIAQSLPFENTANVAFDDSDLTLESFPSIWEQAVFDEILDMATGKRSTSKKKKKELKNLDKMTEEEQLQLFFEFVANEIATNLDDFAKSRRIEVL